MSDKVKVSVLEINGTELFEDTERLLSSDIVDHDPTGTDLVSTDTKAALAELAGRHFGKLYASASQDPNTTSTGTPVEAIATPPRTVTDAGTITFRGQWSFRMVNSKSNTDGLVEVAWRSDQNPGGLVLDQQTASGVRYSNLGGGTGEQTVGFGDFSFTGPQTNIELYLTINRSAGNGAARVNSVRLELWRIS